jgi:FtsZ-binding cell division protein ZapB
VEIERIRNALRDFGSLEAAPRLNAQVRLREEHVEMLQFLLQELDEANNALGSYAVNCKTAMGCW